MDAAKPAPTIFDVQPDPEARVDVRRLPRLTVQGLRLLWAAGRRDLLASTALQAAGGLGVAAQLLVGQRGLRALLAAAAGGAGTGASLGSLAPWALAVAAIAVASFLASAMQRERQQLLGELVSRHVEERVLDVARAVDLAAFDTPSFHNRLQRVRSSAHQPMNLAYGVSGLAGAAVGVLGVVAAWSPSSRCCCRWWRPCSCRPGWSPPAAGRRSSASSGG
jgi:ATP-binding cassette subfamily B protein